MLHVLYKEKVIERTGFFQVFQDDAVVPGWEGKIVAWVEEDHGQTGYRVHLHSWHPRLFLTILSSFSLSFLHRT